KVRGRAPTGRAAIDEEVSAPRRGREPRGLERAGWSPAPRLHLDALKATKENEMELELPPFEEQDCITVERAVEAYRRGSFTRSEMVEKVRAIVEQYDAISRGLAYSAIEDALGEEMADFWRTK